MEKVNIFREAKQLLDKKDNGNELTEEEQELVNTAAIPFTVNTDNILFDIPIGEGLEELARIIENKDAGGDQQTPAPTREVVHGRRKPRPQ